MYVLGLSLNFCVWLCFLFKLCSYDVVPLLYCFIWLLSLPDGRDFLSMSVCFVFCRTLPGEFGLMSLPLCCFARLAEDRPVLICVRRALPGSLDLCQCLYLQ